jgi:hypothetical protein
MTTEQLGTLEAELYSTVINIYNAEEGLEQTKKLEEVFEAYMQVHRDYAKLSPDDDEALKRGLFLQWYAATEPSHLSGISTIDPISERIIIEQIEKRIQNKSIDEELIWMLNYFATWSFVFEKFIDFKGLSELINNKTESLFSKTIDRNNMKTRGQMGQYWNSLIALDK